MVQRTRRASVDELSLSVIEGVEDALLVTDARLGVIAWNSAMERLTGVKRVDALGQSAESILPFLREAGLMAHLKQALAGQVVVTEEFPYALPSLARKGWMLARCVPWRSGAGAVAGVVGFLVDVTDRRRSALFQRAIQAIGQSLTSSLDLDQVLDTIVGKALEVMGAEAAMAVSWDGAAAELQTVTVDGATASILKSDVDALAGSRLDDRSVRLLPAFDPLLLAHAAKDHLVESRFYKRVYRNQGWLSPVVLAGGRIVAVWFASTKGGAVDIEIQPFARLSAATRAAIVQEAEALGRFLDAPCRARM